MLVVVQVLVTERQAIDALCDKVADVVFDEILVPEVMKAMGEPLGQPKPPVNLAQQKTATI